MNLAAVGRLDLVRLLYGAVQIPTAVLEELTSRPNQPGGVEVLSFPWIVTRRVQDRTLVTSLLGELDPGGIRSDWAGNRIACGLANR